MVWTERVTSGARWRISGRADVRLIASKALVAHNIVAVVVVIGNVT